MTATPAAIEGTFSDLRFVKGRAVAQIVIECAIEAGPEIVRLFGTPLPGSEVHVAVARLTDDPLAARGDDSMAAHVKNSVSDNLQFLTPTRRRWSDLSPAEQAGIRCNEPRFSEFLSIEPMDPELAAETIRDECGIKSRGELNFDVAAADQWRELDAAFRAWAGRTTEERG